MLTTDTLAVYGAILSTFLALLEITKFILEIAKNYRKIKVMCSLEISENKRKVLRLEAVNIGHRPISIIQAGLLTNDKNISPTLFRSDEKNHLPKLLNDGESVTVSFDYVILKEAIKGLNISYKSAYMRDAEGKYYKTNLPKNLKKVLNNN